MKGAEIEVFDVVVIGGGGSGLAAAIEARNAGARVVLLEKNDKLGGSTAWSVGSVTSTGTPHQQRNGIQDNPHDHWADMPLFAGELAARDNDALRHVLCDEIPDTMRWLLDLGVRFYGPMPEPPHSKPRMHTVLPNSLSFIYHLGRRAHAAGVEFRFRMQAVELIVEQRRVAAVRCKGGELFEACRAVVLAAGDFTNDPELKARHIGAQEAKVDGVNLTATGDGQKMAMALGARIVNGDLALGPEIRFIAPARPTLARRLPPWPALAAVMEWSMSHLPASLLRPFVMSFLTTALAPSPMLFEQGARLVNRDGKRFCDERDKPALALADQPNKIGYILIDGRLAKQFSAWPHFVSTAPGVAYAYVPDYRRNRPDVYTEAASIDALARTLDMDAAAMRDSLSTSEAAGKLDQPPFIALGPVRPVFVHNEGGLAVDLQHRVLGADDVPIAGLYAAGATGQGGLLLKGHGHHLAWAFVSGRRAGRFAAGDRQSQQTDRRTLHLDDYQP
ncbi:MAG TPA: FAD-dependent oxidoreductase [Burkholderiales bacterium]|nr:FAD-dependent oxidoreductase [Burkholderiales bacterium]